MIKRIALYLLTITLFTGLYFSQAKAGNYEKLQRILQITGLEAKIEGILNAKPVLLRARLDRDLLVYGTPNDVPNNQWKTESEGVTTSWQKANNIDQGHPGEQEPRYLGYTLDGGNFANDYFPDDAEYHISPAKRNMISSPWENGYENSDNRNISDYSWGLIKKALSTYNKRIGFRDDKDGFANNPAFYSDFDNVKKYFKVLAEPRPGMAGAVRHWHRRADLGGVWYDPIFIRWDILPNFIVENIDPGTGRARPGETYTGKVVLKAKPDGSFLSDPVTGQLFNSMGLKLELSRDYTVPLGVVVNGQLVPLKNFQPMNDLQNIYQYKIPAGTTENILEFTFEWTVPANISSHKITLAAGVNESITVLPKDVWGYMEWSEITSSDNVRAVEIPVDLALPDIKTELTADKYTLTRLPGGGGDQAVLTALITRKDDLPGGLPVVFTLHSGGSPLVIPFTLGPGGSHVIPIPFAGWYSATFRGEVWPDGKEDAYPPDNVDSLTITVNQLTVPQEDSEIKPILIDSTRFQ